MKKLVFEQFLPITLEEAWDFFSSPSSLNLITPEKMHFRTLSEIPDQLYQGLIITYRIKPMMKIPMKWVTEIVALKEKEYFIDKQLEGPYKLWHHEHHFKEVKSGVMMTDRLTYDIGLGIIGRIAGRIWVDRQVKDIFEYRREKLKVIFEHENSTN